MDFTLAEFHKLKTSPNQIIDVKILTSSMSPFIEPNDIIKVQKKNINDIKPYDVILFWQDSKLVCHIYIKSIENKFLCRGLNNKHYDPPVETENVLGVVIDPVISNFKKFFLKFLFK